MGVLVKTSLFICILWGIHIWIKQVIDTEENNQKMEETLENMNHSYVEFQGKINQARKYRHDIPKHLHMMEQAVSDIIDDEYSVDTMLNAISCVTKEKCQEYNIQININLAIKEREIFDKLNIDPCIPKEWDKFKVHRVWRGAEYDINVVNPNKVNKGVKEIKLNGEIVDFIPVMEKGSHNLVEITMG